MTILPTAITLARWMAWVGLACGVVYSVGGLAYDLATIASGARAVRAAMRRDWRG